MNSRINSTLLFVLALSVMSPLAGDGMAQARQLTNDMTCQQAQQKFLEDGRVYTRLRTGAVIPMYGGTPVASGKRVHCMREQTQSSKMVATTDKARCPISRQC